jgi:TldD protein
MQFDDVLQEALRFALAAGADYAEARSETSTSERVSARNGGLERLTTDNDAGWGVHAYAGGGWGFAATPDSDSEAIRETAEEAVRIARASGAYRAAPADLSTVPVERGSYEAPTRTDPFSLPVQERVALATECTSRILAASERVKVAAATVTLRRLETLYANSAGARLAQRITEVGARIGGIAVADDGYAYRRSFGDLSRSGWEFVEDMDLRARADRVGREAGELVVAPWAPSGPRQVVLGSDFMALLVHESCGHPTELDRVLGWEAAFAGTSFLMPEMRGSFRYGSPLVNLTADSLLPGGMGTFGWDDEGTPAQRSPIVRDGVFVGYLSHRGSAAALGDPSNGCGRATSWGRIPLVRMVNVSLEPGTGSLDDLIAGVDDGLYIETPSSWSLDDKRMNFHFAGELCREIKGGKLGELRKAASFQGRTPDFWGSVRAIAGPEEWRLWGLPHCAKGEPLQLCPVSHGASPVLVEGLNVSVQGRKS